MHFVFRWREECLTSLDLFFGIHRDATQLRNLEREIGWERGDVTPTAFQRRTRPNDARSNICRAWFDRRSAPSIFTIYRILTVYTSRSSTVSAVYTSAGLSDSTTLLRDMVPALQLQRPVRVPTSHHSQQGVVIRHPARARSPVNITPRSRYELPSARVFPFDQAWSPGTIDQEVRHPLHQSPPRAVPSRA